MKPTKFLTAFTSLGPVIATHLPTGPAANQEESLPVPRRSTHLRWIPPDAYLPRQSKRRLLLEERCDVALAREGCVAGIIHQGETRVIVPHGETSYVNVKGSKSTDMSNPREMRVYSNGWTVHGWTDEDRRRVRNPKPKKKSWMPQPEAVARARRAHLVWDPDDTYIKRPKKRKFWEQRCDVALTREGCGIGVIHKGETTVIKPNGERSVYLNVEGAKLMNMSNPKKLRVYKDASTEDFTERGWTEEDKRYMDKAKYDHARSTRARPPPPPPSAENEPKHSEHSIFWQPPHAYEKYGRLRSAYENACRQALDSEGCDVAMLHQGRKEQKNADGTESIYLNVAARKRADPSSTRYMRLFENGSYEWYPAGSIPWKDLRASTGERRRRNPSAPAQGAGKRPGRPRKERKTRTRAPWGSIGAQMPAQPTHAGPFQAPDGASGGEYYSDSNPYSVTQPSSQEHGQNNAKRRRVGGDEEQFSGQSVPPTQTSPTWRLSWSESGPQIDWY